jgi:hypothetical protein
VWAQEALPGGIAATSVAVGLIVVGSAFYWRAARESRRMRQEDRRHLEQRALRAERDVDRWREYALTIHAEVMQAVAAGFTPAAVARLMSRLTHPSALAPVEIAAEGDDADPG